MRRPAVVLLAILLALLVVPRASAQVRNGGGVQPNCVNGCGGGGSAPSVTWLQPSPTTVYTSTPTLQVDFCDNNAEGSMSGRYITLNSTNVTSSFDYVSAGDDCTSGHFRSTSTSVTLSLGWNTLYAKICDGTHCGEAYYNVLYLAGPVPSVSLAPHSAGVLDYRRCANACFAATYAQGTVPYFALGSARSAVLVYNSDRADPRPFIHVDVTHGGDGTNLPSNFYLQVKSGSSLLTFVNGSTKLYFGAATGTRRFGAQFAADSNGMSATNSYPITIILGATYSGGVVEDTLSTRVIVVNEESSGVGRGWTVSGVQRLYATVDTTQGVLITEADGSAFFFARSGSTYTAPAGNFSALTSSGSGSSRTYTRAYPDSTKVTFNYQGYMVQVVDAWGNKDSVTYDGSNRVARLIDPLGNYHQFTYGSYGVSSIAALGRSTGVAVGSNGTLTAITDPDNMATTFGYDSYRRLASVTNRLGDTITTIRYVDALSNRVDSVMGPSIALYGGSSGRPTTTLASWQRAGVPYGATSSGSPFTPPGSDTVRATMTDPGGHVTRYTANAFGQPLVASDATGDTVTVHYTSAGLPDSTAPRWGARTSVRYDASGLDTLVTAEGVSVHQRFRRGFAVADTIWGDATATVRDSVGANGRVVATSIAKRPATGYTYNSRGQVTQVSMGHGHWYTYDATTGNISRDSSASIWADSATRPIVHVFGYDGLGRLVSDSLVGVAKATTVYDTLNRPIARNDGVNAASDSIRYSALYTIRTRDPGGNVDSVMYNAAGWRVAHKDPAGARDSTFYDLDGLVRRTVNRRGQSIIMSYDARHRMVGRSGTRIAADTVVFSSDSVVAVGNSAEADTTYLNRRGTPDSVVTVLNGPNTAYRQRFRYRANGLLDSTWVTGPTVTFLPRRYAYDSTFAVDSIKLGTFGWTRIRPNDDGTPAATYLPNSGHASDSIAAGVTPNGLPASVRSSVLADYDDYDAAGRLILHRTTDPYYVYGAGLTTVYGYDRLNRLGSVHFYGGSSGCWMYGVTTWTSGGLCDPGMYAPDSSHGLSYDALGNRTDNSGSYGAGSRIQAFGGCSYSTDADGNVTQRSCSGQTVNFTWTADSRLDSVKITGGPTIVFAYDHSGHVVRRDSAGGAASNFLWQGDDLLAELGPAGTSRLGEYSYYAGMDRLHAWRGVSAPYDTTVLYAHQDVLGNIRGLSWGWYNSSERTYEYTEWGASYATSATTYDRARWKGALSMAPEAGLYYMRARWYDPLTGRFLSEDPAGQGANGYLFANANPISGADPSGLCWHKDPDRPDLPPHWDDMCDLDTIDPDRERRNTAALIGECRGQMVRVWSGNCWDPNDQVPYSDGLQQPSSRPPRRFGLVLRLRARANESARCLGRAASTGRSLLTGAVAGVGLLTRMLGREAIGTAVHNKLLGEFTQSQFFGTEEVSSMMFEGALTAESTGGWYAAAGSGALSAGAVMLGGAGGFAIGTGIACALNPDAY